AEFIRAEIELERLGRWSERRQALSERTAELLGQYRERWEEGFPAWADSMAPNLSGGWCPPQGMDSLLQYRRGFRQCAWTSPAEFAARTDELLAAFPVQCVVFPRARESSLLFRDCPALARLRDVRLDLFASDFAIEEFVECPGLAGLKFLALEFF